MAEAFYITWRRLRAGCRRALERPPSRFLRRRRSSRRPPVRYAWTGQKWLCAPKGAGFLWARPEHQRWIEPLVVSWGWGAETSFAERHGWQGTRDPAAYLAVPDAIAFVREHGRPDERRALVDGLAERLPYRPVPGRRAPFMGAWELPQCDAEEVQRRLYDEHRVEVPVRDWEGRQLVRVSVGPYTDASDLGRLEAGLGAIIGAR